MFARGFGERLVGALGRGDGVGALAGCAGFVVVVEQDWRQGLFYVPADVVGQHRQEHVGAHPIGEVVADGPHVELAVEGAEEPLDVFESLVAQHHIVVGEGVDGQAGAQHVDAVEGGLGGDGVLVAARGDESSVMVMVKCLAILNVLIILPTRSPMVSLPRSGRRARRVAAVILSVQFRWRPAARRVCGCVRRPGRGCGSRSAAARGSPGG